MEIITNSTDERNNHITVTDDDGTQYEYSAGLFRGAVTAEDCLFDIKQQMFVGKHKVILQEATEDEPEQSRPCQTLEEINQWIADNPDIEPIPWVSTHPEFPTASGEERATMVTDAKELIVNLTYADIDAHIDNVFGNLNVAQRASLKKLYKATLFLLKK